MQLNKRKRKFLNSHLYCVLVWWPYCQALATCFVLVTVSRLYPDVVTLRSNMMCCIMVQTTEKKHFFIYRRSTSLNTHSSRIQQKRFKLIFFSLSFFVCCKIYVWSIFHGFLVCIQNDMDLPKYRNNFQVK